MPERYGPGQEGKPDKEHQGVKPGQIAERKGSRVPPQNPHRDPEGPKKGGRKPKHLKDKEDINSGIEEYFDSRGKREVGSTKGSSSKDMIARAVRPPVQVAPGDLKPATDADRHNALDPEKVHGTRVGQTQRSKTETVPPVSEVIPQRIETLEAFDSRYPHVASLQAFVNENSKTDIAAMNEWRPEFSTALREFGYELGNEHNGIYDVEYHYGQTKVESEMSVSQLLGILRDALQERQKLIPREPFIYGKLTPKILEQITPSELEDIMGPDGVHKSIKRALVALGYKNAHFMLRGGQEVVEVTRSIQGKDRGTQYEIPADSLRTFLQKRIDEYHEEKLASLVTDVAGTISHKEELLHEQLVVSEMDSNLKQLTPEGREAFNTLTSEDIESILNVKGGSPRVVDFLKKGLGYDVVSVNEDGELSFLDKEGLMVVSKGNDTHFRVKPFEVWRLLRTAWIESHRDGVKALELFNPADVKKNGAVTAEEVQNARDRFFASNDGEIEPEDEGTYDQENSVFKGVRQHLSVRGDELEKTLDLGEGSVESGSDDTESGEHDLPDDLDETQDLEQDEGKKGIISRITDTVEDVDLDSTQPEDWRTMGRAGDSEYHEMDEFVEQMAGLGLRVISQEGDMVTFQAEMPGAPIQTERKSELLTFINGEEDPEPIEVPVVPPRVEEETDAHGNNLQESLTKREEKERVLFFEERFTHEFGISKEDLMGIGGFRFLSKEQQKLVYENFVQCTLGSVHSEAVRLTKSVALEKRAVLAEKLTPFIGNMVASFRDALTNKYTTLNKEKDVLEQMRMGGFALHEELLTELVTHIEKYGPRVHENEQGELMVDLVNVRERAHESELRGREWHAMKDLNEKGHAFAQIPASWRGQTLGIDEESEWKVVGFLRKKFFGQKDHEHEIAYKKAEDEYTASKKTLETVLKEKGMDDLEVAQSLIQIDARVTSLQTLQTNPDALLELSEIEKRSTPQLAKEAALEFIKGPGVYMTLGIGLRSLSAALGFIGAPIGSSAVAALRSWNRTDAELRERDRNATTGTKDTKEGALNINDAEDLTWRMRYILDRCRDPRNEDKKPALLAQLRSRAEYIHDKQKLNMINYGGRDGMITRQTLLMESVSEAYTYLTAEAMTDDAIAHANVHFAESRERLDTQLKKTEAMLKASRKKGRQTDLMISAVKAAAISTAAAYAVDCYHEWRSGALASQALTSGPQTAFKGDVPFVPTPVVDAGVDPFTRIAIEKGVQSNGFPEELTPSISGIDTLDGVESDLGTLNTSPQIEMDTAVEAEINAGTYTIKSGDTLTKILNEQVPEIKALDASVRRGEVVEFLRGLKPSELRAVGIYSDSVNKIRAGDTLNIAKLREIVRVDLGLSNADVVTTPSASSPVSEITPSGVQGETARTVTPGIEPNRPGQIRPAFTRPALSPESVIPNAEVTLPANNVVELSPVREAKVVQERVIEVLKLKKDWSAVSGRFTSDLPEAVRTHSAESPALRKALKDALYAEQALTKTLKLEERTETVGEFMKRAAKEIVKLSPEAQNKLFEKITPKGNGTFATPEPTFHPGQIRPGSIEHGVPTAKVPEAPAQIQPVEQPPVASKFVSEAPKPVVRIGDVPPPKTSVEFNRFLINSRQIPLQSWVILRDKPDSDFVFMDIQMEDVLKNPTVSGDTKKMIFLRRLLFEETGLGQKSGEKLEDYFKRADDFIQGHENVKARYLNHIVGPYQEFVRGIDNASTYEIQPK